MFVDLLCTWLAINDSQTNRHSNNVRPPKQTPSVSEPSKVPPLDKNHFSSLFILPRIKSFCEQGTGDDLTNTQYDLHYGILLVSAPGGDIC